ncbi:MAG: hypothetical protein MK116_10670 [Phycisphaerales bacterium]|nr:hypothetical protein [Phycisphaerales bacterium]
MSDTSTPQGPGKVLIWLLLLLAFVGIGIGIYFMGPWLQDEVNSAPGADAGAPTRETTSE